MHLSRLSEELVLWSSGEFNFIEIDDTYTTGSSIMPQKKNPDIAELARGKTGRVYGNLMGLLTTMKGLPLAYNRDMQEDKEGFFDTVDTLMSTLEVFTGMLKSIRIKTGNMESAAKQGYLLATDVADYLVKKGVSFRTAHEATAKLVTYAIQKDKSLKDLTLKEYQKFSPVFDKDVYEITLESSVTARDIMGGTGYKQVAKQITAAKRKLKESMSDG
jgi:argininosuccinate lyase